LNQGTANSMKMGSTSEKYKLVPFKKGSGKHFNHAFVNKRS